METVTRETRLGSVTKVSGLDRELFVAGTTTPEKVEGEIRDLQAAEEFAKTPRVETNVGDIASHIDNLAQDHLRGLENPKEWKSEVQDSVLFPIAKQKVLRQLYEETD